MSRQPILPPNPPEPPKRRSLIGVLRNNFIAGVVVIAPIGLTVWLIWTMVGWIDSWVLPFVPDRFNPEQYIGINLRGVGVIFFILFTFLVGALAKGFVGRSLLRFGEGIVGRMPVVRSIYSGLKQIAETVFAQSESSFDQACLIEYPRKGLWALAFISTRAKGEVARKLPPEGDIVTVFLPTTPNPTSGFLLFLPRADVILLDMSVEEAAKLVISAGLVTPPDRERPVEAEPLRTGTSGR
ncbi:DUF502 domain-containing protein [Limimaricola pyoseonensis]|uniref:Uncharacterized membrane protein n=1 Tax=Limimaricola pyoseonensis TaxID=521013 RepID=A0A1G7ACD4_9RHOB|nr:DUF502 domain-containing protein [Limimaricola pyoseonensis]SDE11526.1 Uncharacterized membrane protein [Limimaricola pyoseonensis]